MFIPPRWLAIIPGFYEALSKMYARYISFLSLTPSATKTASTLNPSPVVYLVVRLYPRILDDISEISYEVLTTWTPPYNPLDNLPFPLPPAWT